MLGLVLELMHAVCRGIQVLLSVFLPSPPLLCQCWSVLVLDLRVVRTQIRGEIRVEVVQTDDQRERRREQSHRERTVSGEDASCQSGNSDVK